MSSGRIRDGYLDFVIVFIIFFMSSGEDKCFGFLNGRRREWGLRCGRLEVSTYFKSPTPQPPLPPPSIQEAKAFVLTAAHEEDDEDDDEIKVSIPNSPARHNPQQQRPENGLNFFRVE